MESEQLLRIETESLVLRPFEIGDTATVYALSTEPASRKWLPSQVYADEAEARETLEFLREQYSRPADPRSGPYVLAVDHRGDDTLIGHVGLSPLDGDVEIGFSIAEAYQGQGLAVEAVSAACLWAFGRFGLSRILAIAAQSNQGSRKVLARAGFEHQTDRVMDFQGVEQAVSEYALFGSGARKEE
ncbi:MAG: GNAT family N-acetyltransferase [Candidatus Krumholzibacteria bacterium]|jgi:RimJ/RimL family protein N-acetyltransferase|nr:GNAT family N-acetyltransferase [Candidatus Krumholzibacteria bacterium]MDP7022476.1 GNAT family N-acetyltransferase [Candidatus Krumholzibacteria bacterium]